MALAASPTGVGEIALDPTAVYWTGAADVSMAPLDGGGVTTLTTGLDQPAGIAVDGAGVYFTVWATPSETPTLMKVPLDGGAAAALAAGFWVNPIAVSHGVVYGTGSANAQDTSTYLLSVLVGGGAVTTLAPASVPNARYDFTSGIAVEGTNVYWAWSDSSPTNPAPIMKMAVDGGPATTLAMGSGVRGFAVDGVNLYWTNSGDDTVMKVPSSGGSASTLAANLTVGGIATDGQYVYVTSGRQCGSVLKIAVDGSSITTLATGQLGVGSIVVDATSVYWAATTTVSDDAGAVTSGPVNVMKLTPK